MYVKWKDSPGTKSTISVKFQNCGSGNPNENAGDTEEELILSIKDKDWDPFTPTTQTLDYCSQSSVNVIMPRMFVQGTGGVGQPPLTEVAYQWKLPAGWKEVGTGRTEFGTAANYIAIEPDNCAVPGDIKVFGTLKGTLCGSAADSKTATIPLRNPQSITASVTPQSGYSGGSACNLAPVTFFANTTGTQNCISGYEWIYPFSWQFGSQSGNSITLIPSGTAADSNPVKVKVNFSCGTSVTSGEYIPSFAVRVTLGPSDICSSGTASNIFSVTNLTPGTSVTWHADPDVLEFNSTGAASVRSNYAQFNGQVAVWGTIINGNCAVSAVPKSVQVGVPPIAFSQSFDYNCNQTLITINPTSYDLIFETTNGLLINGNTSPYTWLSNTYGGSVTVTANGNYDPSAIIVKAACNGSVVGYMEFQPCLPWNANLHLLTSTNPLQGEPMDAAADPNPWGGRYLWYINGNLITTTHEPEVRIYGWPCGESYLEVQSEGYAGVTDPHAARVDYWGMCTGYYAVYPNPASGFIEVIENQVTESLPTSASAAKKLTTDKKDEILELRLYNHLQVLVKSMRYKSPGTRISVEDLPSGTYILHVVKKDKIDKEHIFLQK